MKIYNLIFLLFGFFAMLILTSCGGSSTKELKTCFGSKPDNFGHGDLYC